MSIPQDLFPYPYKKDIAVVLLYLFCAVIGSYVADAAFVSLAFLSAKYKQWTFKSLTLMLLLIFINPGLVIIGQSHALLLRWLVIGVAVAKYLFKSERVKKKFAKWEIALLVFALYCLIASFFTSNFFVVSFQKIIMFTGTFLATGKLVVTEKNNAIDKWMMAVAVVIVVSSLLLIPFPVGRIRNSVAFQGVLNQPNGFGVYLSPFAAWFFCLFVSYKNTKFRFFSALLFIITAVLMYLSASRTSLLSLTISIVLSYSIIIIKGFKSYGIILKSSIFILSTIVVAYWLVDTFASDNVIVQSVSRFIYKGKDNNYSNAILNSRQAVLDNSMRNIREKPYFGIGFGTPSIPVNFQTNSIGGITIGAPVEKGTIATALLEETGIFGVFLFLVLLFHYTKRVVLQGNLISNATLWSAFLISFGEMVFFSPGGLGMHVYLFMAFARWNTFPMVKGGEIGRE